ncbi:MAG: CAP domain-containing protein [Longimicrobiaceae bacterium]
MSRTVEVRDGMRPELRRWADSVAAVREGELAEILTHDPGQRRPRLAWNPILAKVARERAWDMAVRGYFAHVTPEGIGPNTLVERAGYVLPAAYDHALSGNNIESAAQGYASARAAWRHWMGSPPHRAHLLGLDPEQRRQSEFGIGYAQRPGDRFGAYWVVLIAEPGAP